MDEEELQRPAKVQGIDADLLKRFQDEIAMRMPHAESVSGSRTILNPTPLTDLSEVVIECAKAEYGIDLSTKNVRVFGKFDSGILGGSIKARPAVQIIEDAIASGKLRRGQIVFEATSGNFGLALGLLRRLGLEVVVLVSRKLQQGVLDELRRDGVKMANLDIDICPAPGLKEDSNVLIAKGVTASLRDQLGELGLNVVAFDDSREEIEETLARQDVISLAKLLARIYDGFCPEQYDNELNVRAHETVTGPEIDQQLKQAGLSMADFQILTAFGTGGTSMGLGRYLQWAYGRKAVRVVFPLGDQDVAGIRTKEKASGLRFYDPRVYAGQHEVDFEAAKRALRFFVSKGYDIGESSALALYACVQLLNFDAGDKFVVILADGTKKYASNVQAMPEVVTRYEVTLQEARSSQADYGAVLWTHGMFRPKDEGIKVIASSLGMSEDKIGVAGARAVQKLLSGQELPESLLGLMPRDGRRLLLVCMAGGTSLQVARILAKKGIRAESLTGGIGALSAGQGKQVPDLVQLAIE